MSSYSYSGYSYCVAPNCKKNAKTNPELSYFRFPKDRERCLAWIAKIKKGHDFLHYTPEQCHLRYRLCSLHFEDTKFSSLLKNRLKKTAIPTLCIDANSDDTPNMDESGSGAAIKMEVESDSESSVDYLPNAMCQTQSTLAQKYPRTAHFNVTIQTLKLKEEKPEH